jgi:catechol 2,3-dioxygenase-like lactoylglutathione lyase family enzyme
MFDVPPSIRLLRSHPGKLEPFICRANAALPPEGAAFSSRERRKRGDQASVANAFLVMEVEKLDHVNILTGNVERTIGSLTTVLGLEDGPRPAFRSPGHWLYRNDAAVVHVSDVRDKEQTHAAEVSLGDPNAGEMKGVVDHVAFRCTGYHRTKERLAELGISWHEAVIPGVGDHQLFIDGPDDVSFELIFTAADVTGTR